MEYVIEGSKVFKVTENKNCIIKESYDTLFHTKLSYQNNIVKAEIYNYLDEPQTNQNIEIPFVLDEQEIIVYSVNGIAEIEFISEVKGEYCITTSIPNYRNGEVVINVE